MIASVSAFMMGSYYWVYARGLANSATAVVFLATFFLGFWVFFRTEKKLLTILASVLGLIGFLDEVSWGEGALISDMPRVNNSKINAFHDLIGIAFWFVYNLLTKNHVLAYSVIVFVGITVILLAVKFRHFIARELAKNQTYVFALAFGLLGSVALLIDFYFIRLPRKYFGFLEETLEVVAALALFFLTLALRKPISASSAIR